LGMANMLKSLIGENINFDWRPAENLWQVKMDPSQIDQILTNFCTNARDAISDIGKITIETRNCTPNEDFCAAHPWFVPGEYVQLAVSDDGCGMDKGTLANIFEPFFTTKGIGKGTGLGLSTVYGIAKQNNCFIDVNSAPGKGTTCAIYLPRYAGEAEQAREAGAAKPAMGCHETILLVEDEPAILQMATRVLETKGYKVLAASTPSAAIRIAKEHSGEISLLLTDVVMPEMSGQELAKYLLSLYPQLKRLFMSGYTADVISGQGVLDEGVHFIQKPFSMQDLAVKVREVLEAV
jgi:two-component system cell cycle sensor histidine kinase/response regulator CckA